MGALNEPMSAVKRAVNRSPVLYRCLYSLATLNLDYTKQLLNRSKYPSKYGGMWTDRSDFETLVRRKSNSGELGPEMEASVRRWREDGFVVLNGAIDPAMIDTYLDELEALKRESPSSLWVTSVHFQKPQRYDPDLIKIHDSVRIVDDYFFSSASRALLFHPAIITFLKVVFESQPLLTQSLSFKYGSEQAVHQDTAFVRMNSPFKLAAAWIALEDVEPGCGELVYYPGSHRWPDFLFSDRFKHYNKIRDGADVLDAWYRWIHEEAARRGTDLMSFRARKGDVLLWHAGLAHGGAPISEPSASRLSLVGHYCPRGVRPLYHLYKFSHRKLYRDRDRLYCSSYYRG